MGKFDFILNMNVWFLCPVVS